MGSQVWWLRVTKFQNRNNITDSTAVFNDRFSNVGGFLRGREQTVIGDSLGGWAPGDIWNWASICSTGQRKPRASGQEWMGGMEQNDRGVCRGSTPWIKKNWQPDFIIEADVLNPATISIPNWEVSYKLWAILQCEYSLVSLQLTACALSCLVECRKY